MEEDEILAQESEAKTLEDLEVEEMSERRDETMPLGEIDLEFYERYIEDKLNEWESNHAQYFCDRAEWLLAARDLKYQCSEEGESDIHLPYTLTMQKAMQARIYQIFSTPNFFSVESRSKALLDNETTVRDFMRWVWDKNINRSEGAAGLVDRNTQSFTNDGSSILKWAWDRWEVNYQELQRRTKFVVNENTEPDDLGLTEMREEVVEETVLEDVEVNEKREAGRLVNVKIDDFKMPPDQESIQFSPWISHRIPMTDDMIVERMKAKRFDKERAEMALQNRRNPGNEVADNMSGNRYEAEVARLEGVNNGESGTTIIRHDTENHQIEEFYCKALVKREVDEEDFRKKDAKLTEVIFWYHRASRKILGWTYLHRLCPDGHRPFSKEDFIPCEQRAFGIGVPELLYSLNTYMDAIHRLKMDNGMLSSLQWGVYKSSSTLKPETFKIKRGEVLPVEDINDVKLFNFPYLNNFAEGEEATLAAFGDRLLAINDVTMGNLSAKGVAGALRNATGAQYVDKQSSIQLHPHLARLSRVYNRALSSLLILYRERSSSKLVYRVTGEDGKPVFGEVDRTKLLGDYDFTSDIDVLGTSDAERQQRTTLMLQTLLNPTMMQFGIVTPVNLYNVTEQYLRDLGVKRPSQFITKPQGYTGPTLSPEQRVHRLIFDLGADGIENTIQVAEDHDAAIQYLEALQLPANQHLFNMIDSPRKLATYDAMLQKHRQFQQTLQQGNAMANSSGQQMPSQGGLQGMMGGLPDGTPQAPTVGQGPLSSPMGEPNGPVF